MLRATPVLYGDDAERLLESLRDIAPRAEIEKRQRAARAFMAHMMKPKTGSKKQLQAP